MTHEAKPHDPIIKQHLDTIEDQIVVDAIAKRMARTHDHEGPRYSHDTHFGTHPSIQYISDACAQVYQPGMSHEEVWHAGLRFCVSGALENAYKLEDSSLAEKDKLDAEFDRSMSMYAAIAMHAIEYQSPDYDPSKVQEIDEMLLSTTPNLRTALGTANSYMRAYGYILYDEATNNATLLSDIVHKRQCELAQINYERTLKGLLDSRGVPVDRWESNEDYMSRRYDYLRIRHAGLSDEQYDAFAAAVQQFTLAGHWANAAALRALPKDYLADAYENHNEAAQTIELLLEAYLQSALPDEEADPNFYTVLHDYFPGGLTGAIARAHPLMQRLYARHGGALNLLIDALPTAEYVTGRGTDREILERNQLSRSIMQAAFREILDDDEFAERFYTDVKMSVEPRTFNEQDKLSHDGPNDKKLIERLRALHQIHGTETLRQLHEQFDLSAYDYLTDTDIETLIGLQRGDAGTIKRLQAKDVSLVMYDSRGSDNSALHFGLKNFEQNNPLLARVALAWNKPTDFYRMIALLEKHDIQFCNLFFLAHGSPGKTHFNRGSQALQLSSLPAPDLDDDDTTLPLLDKRSGPKVFHIDSSQLGRIVRDRMCLPKYADELQQPNKKRVMFASCYSDVEPHKTTTKSIADIAATAIAKAQLWPEKPKPLHSRSTPRREADGKVDSHIIGTANVSLLADRTGGGIGMGGPGRDESDTLDKSKTYGPNTVTLIPYENRIWIGGKQVGSNLSIRRNNLDERILA